MVDKKMKTSKRTNKRDKKISQQKKTQATHMKKKTGRRHFKT
jgi:hypothetical protein